MPLSDFPLDIALIGVANPYHAVGAMRAPMGNGDKSDSNYLVFGPQDIALAQKLILRGDSHAKFMRQLLVWLRITGPRYWWQEFDTYRLGVDKVSSSSRYALSHRELTQADFAAKIPSRLLGELIVMQREQQWYELKQLLPESYLQERYVMCSYQALRKMTTERWAHWLPEWRYFVTWVRERVPWAEQLIFVGMEAKGDS